MTDHLDLVRILDESARRFERLHGQRPVAVQAPETQTASSKQKRTT